MFAEFGHFALILLVAAGFSQAVLFCPVWLRSVLTGKTAIAHSANGTVSVDGPAFSNQDDDGCSGNSTYKNLPHFLILPGVMLLLGLISEGALIHSFVVSDFSLPIVADLSHSSTPLTFRIGAALAPDGGVMVLWLLATTIVNAALAGQVWAKTRLTHRRTSQTISETVAQTALALTGILIAILAVVTLVDADPFLRTAIAPLDGRGMDPEKQDLLHILKDPFLFAGQACLGVICALTLTGLITGDIERRLSETLRIWVITAWLCLTVALVIMTYRSYSEQAWGNWWYWNTAENSLLLPWLLTTALLHCRAVLEKTETLKVWTAFLGISSFAVCWFGLYLSRSGLLEPMTLETESDTSSLGILIGFCLFFAGAYILFWRRADKLREERQFVIVSRESAMFVNSVLLSLIASVILIGTIYPLMLRWLDGDNITVGGPFYTETLIPFVLPLMFLMGFAPVVKWRQDELWLVGGRMKLAAMLSLIIVLFISIRFIDLSPLPLIGIGLAGWIVTASLGDLWARLWHQPDHGESKYRNLQLLGPRYLSMTCAHIGVAIMIAGASASSVWKEEQVVSARAGQSLQVGPYNLQYEGVALLAGENFATRKATFILYHHSLPVTELFPEIRYYPIRGAETREADIWHGRDGDVHVSVGERTEDGGRVVTVRYLPMMPWVWAGMILMLLGGTVSILTRIFLRLRKLGVPTS
ncbi:cytochrome c biogenesis protein CcsA [Thalassospira sp. MA62]|nr:cytochrome c biogenesis protein CcsA [Thalassospira sp. MA62]